MEHRMKTEFSEASRLIVKDWDVVKEINRAQAELAGELRDFLFSIESQLDAYPWWDQGWVFKRLQDNQVYVTHREWQRDEEYAIWIGVEGFTPDALFGTDSYASLYVYVTGSRSALVASLRQSLAGREGILGDVRVKGGSGYVVKSALRKCLPDELDTFADVVGQPILDFLEYYVGLHDSFTALLVETEASAVQ